MLYDIKYFYLLYVRPLHTAHIHDTRVALFRNKPQTYITEQLYMICIA